MEELLSLLGKKPAKEGERAAPGPDEGQASDDALKLRLCRLIIDRYRGKIEEYESKSVSDLKLLIQPRHPVILRVKESISENFHPYIYDEHFLEAAKMAFSHVSSFKTVSSPVPFWLTPDEVSELMAGDEIDKSIFLCSLLRSLGSESARVFLTDAQNSFVTFEHQGKRFAADHSGRGIAELPEGRKLPEMRGRPLYSFSDTEYEDFQEN